MYVAWYDSQQEQEAVEHGIIASSREHHDGQRREEDVDASEDDAVSEPSHLRSGLSNELPLSGRIDISSQSQEIVSMKAKRKITRTLRKRCKSYSVTCRCGVTM